MGILDDYFDGYYSEDMLESQVFLEYCFPAVFKHNKGRVLPIYSVFLKLRKHDEMA